MEETSFTVFRPHTHRAGDQIVIKLKVNSSRSSSNSKSKAAALQAHLKHFCSHTNTQIHKYTQIHANTQIYKSYTQILKYTSIRYEQQLSRLQAASQTCLLPILDSHTNLTPTTVHASQIYMHRKYTCISNIRASNIHASNKHASNIHASQIYVHLKHVCSHTNLTPTWASTRRYQNPQCTYSPILDQTCPSPN